MLVVTRVAAMTFLVGFVTAFLISIYPDVVTLVHVIMRAVVGTLIELMPF